MLPTLKFWKSKGTGVKCLPDGELSVGRKRWLRFVSCIPLRTAQGRHPPLGHASFPMPYVAGKGGFYYV